MEQIRVSLRELGWLFLKLGMIAFGGPAAHIAMMQDEVVQKRKWMTDEHFLDLVGATSLIPGPNSTEMAIHCGYHTAGWRGLLLSGACFILPATLITGVMAWVVVEFRHVPQFGVLLFGIKPAVIAIILGAVLKLGKKAVKSGQLALIGSLVMGAVVVGANGVLALLCGGGLGLLWYGWKSRAIGGLQASPLGSLVGLGVAGGSPLFGASLLAGKVTLFKLFLVFLKVGAVLFGSGYVLVAYLEGELVTSLGWLTKAQLLDAIAIGQFTPGPVLSTSTFVGYQIAGVGGAMVATLGIFLPSFFFVALLNPFIPKLRKSKLVGAFLDAVNVSALGLMMAVVLRLGAQVLFDWKASVLFVCAMVAVFGTKEKVSAVWVVVGGGVLGYLLSFVG